MNIVRGNFSRAIAKGAYCEGNYDGYRVGFEAPIAIEANDQVAVDTESGQPYAIYRPGAGVVWVYKEPRQYVEGHILYGELAPEQYEAALAALGVLA